MKDLSKIKFLAVYAIQKGFTISVFDGEEWSILRSVDAEAVVNEVQQVDQVQLKIHFPKRSIEAETFSKEPLKLETEETSAVCIASFALEDEEQVMDSDLNPFWDYLDIAYDDFYEAEQNNDK